MPDPRRVYAGDARRFVEFPFIQYGAKYGRRQRVHAVGFTLLLAMKGQQSRHFVADGDLRILDAGINIAEFMRSEYHHMFPVRGYQEARTETYTVVGPICSPSDTQWAAR